MTKKLRSVFGLTNLLILSACQIETTAQDKTDAIASVASPIVGGEKAPDDEYPFMVALVTDPSSGDSREDQFCGGALIREDFVLTAAHCLVDEGPGTMAVLVGTNVLNATAGDRVAVAALHVHPDYQYETSENDIALIELARPLSGHPTVPLGDVGDDGTSLTVIGWGNTKGTGLESYPRALRRAQVSVIDGALCNSTDWYNGALKTGMFCAGYPDGGIDTCQGDSGGPALRFRQDKPELVGVTSWGMGCADAHAPGVYTRVSTYEPFVQRVMNKTR